MQNLTYFPYKKRKGEGAKFHMEQRNKNWRNEDGKRTKERKSGGCSAYERR